MRTDEYWDNVKIIKNNISEASLWEQLAEECTELAQVSIKMSRKLRKENYTPLSKRDIEKFVIEEYTDVILCANILKLKSSINIMDAKLQRWADRLNSIE